MIEEPTVDQEVSLSWDTFISREDKNEVAMFNLIPAGTYLGVLVNAKPKVIKTQRGDHPLEGKTVAKLAFLLNGETRDYHLFVDAIPEVIKATSKAGGTYLRSESEIATKLTAALDMLGEDFSKVLDAAVVTTLKFVIGISHPKDPQYEPKNTVKIYRIPEVNTPR